ncbi:hypothetical protein VNO78_07025 [Psophocarpus tetragonolobus]|uniref:Gnk2-homologous domain-containing protein n=1 Tax=Psophocarpus tetragonolobus TaxID=3891 RepID=A0AAN9XRG5_PSOTE
MLGALLNLRSTCFAFLFLLSFRPLIMKAQTPIYVGSNCQNNPQQHLSSEYKTNIKKMLKWASSDSASSKGYNSTRIGNESLVYGYYDCRGDVVGYFCQFCVSNAAREVPRRCPNRVSAMVWYDYCILKYSNERFFGTVLTNQSWHALGTKNISNKAEIQKDEDFVRSLITKATKETNQLYYMDYFNLSFTQRRFGMVQCSRDLTNEGCRQCLEAMLTQVPICCGQKIGWLILSGTCMIRYDHQMFYLLNNQTSSLPVPNMQTAEELEKAWRIWCAGKCLELMDPILVKSFIGSEVERCIHIGLLCVQEDAKDRPTMSDVVVMLVSETMALPKPKHPAFSTGIMDSDEVPTSKRSKNLSNNDVTVSISLPR